MKFFRKHLILIAPILLIICTLSLYYWHFAVRLNKTVRDTGTSEWGTFGDFFGGILNPLLAFLNLYLIVIAFRKNETDSSLNQHENRFFFLLTHLQTIIDSISSDKIKTGYNKPDVAHRINGRNVLQEQIEFVIGIMPKILKNKQKFSEFDFSPELLLFGQNIFLIFNHIEDSPNERMKLKLYGILEANLLDHELVSIYGFLHSKYGIVQRRRRLSLPIFSRVEHSQEFQKLKTFIENR